MSSIAVQDAPRNVNNVSQLNFNEFRRTFSDLRFGETVISVLTQIPKLSVKFEANQAAFSIGGSNFGEVGGGQYKRLSKSGLRWE